MDRIDLGPELGGERVLALTDDGMLGGPKTQLIVSRLEQVDWQPDTRLALGAVGIKPELRDD